MFFSLLAYWANLRCVYLNVDNFPPTGWTGCLSVGGCVWGGGGYQCMTVWRVCVCVCACVLTRWASLGSCSNRVECNAVVEKWESWCPQQQDRRTVYIDWCTTSYIIVSLSALWHSPDSTDSIQNCCTHTLRVLLNDLWVRLLWRQRRNNCPLAFEGGGNAPGGGRGGLDIYTLHWPTSWLEREGYRVLQLLKNFSDFCSRGLNHHILYLKTL